MYISFSQFSLKPDYSEEDVMKLFNESAIPIFRTIPGCVSYDLLKYLPDDTGTVRWEYAVMQVWESEEYRKKAVDEKKIGMADSELQRTGFYDKFRDMAENYYIYNFSISDDSNPFMGD
ncbi:hypothetical protein GF312_02785 [Candidatus Poribacteria bacterium]|nr:hypothetical protein [Candidatus Poribacteria bacterium]